MDDAAGMFAGETIYDDSDAEQIASLPETAAHRNVDIAVQQADIDGDSTLAGYARKD